jgi:hypothetical protein
MQVWIVESGENYEGGSVVGIFADEQSARACALDYPCAFGKWRQHEENVWGAGCDWLTITPYEVEPNYSKSKVSG